jgi:histidinol-phosphate aminotransferase
LVDFGTAERAEGTRLALKDQGILVRQVGGYGLPTCLRISIGTEDEMRVAVQAIKDVL